MTFEIKVAIAAMALLACSSLAHAAPPSPDNAPIQLPLDIDLDPGLQGANLAATPANDDLEREYPRVALLMGLAGHATMTCKALTDGRLDDCHVVEEDPIGLGFGAATVRTAAFFRVKPATRNGQPIEAKITIPLAWRTEEGHPPTLAPPLASASPAALMLAHRVVTLEDMAGRKRASWQPMIEQQTAELMTEGDAQAGQTLIDAFRQGLNDAIQEDVERQAHELGARLGEADLRATVAFLETPAGKAWLSVDRLSGAGSEKTFYRRVAALARNHYCPQTSGCGGPKASSPAAP